MKRSACSFKGCAKTYWAQTTEALGVKRLPNYGWSAQVPSEPKTHLCHKHRSKVKALKKVHLWASKRTFLVEEKAQPKSRKSKGKKAKRD